MSNNLSKYVNDKNIEVSSNGWQNIGIMAIWSMDNIDDDTYRWTFLKLVIHSFGYCKPKTNHITMQKFAIIFDMSRASLMRHIKYLEDNNHIKVITHKGYMKNGGSKPNAYAPAFPKGYANIKLDSSSTKQEPTPQKEIESLPASEGWGNE